MVLPILFQQTVLPALSAGSPASRERLTTTKIPSLSIVFFFQLLLSRRTLLLLLQIGRKCDLALDEIGQHRRSAVEQHEIRPQVERFSAGGSFFSELVCHANTVSATTTVLDGDGHYTSAPAIARGLMITASRRVGHF